MLPPLNRKSGYSGGFLRPILGILNTFRCSTWADRFCDRGTALHKRSIPTHQPKAYTIKETIWCQHERKKN